jgi:hypothetical protein
MATEAAPMAHAADALAAAAVIREWSPVAAPMGPVLGLARAR